MELERQLCVAGGAAVLLGTGMTPASAGGSLTSSSSGVSTGFNSRTRTDNSTDGVNGSVTITGCTEGITVAVYRETSSALDQEVARGATCDTPVCVGDVQTGGYLSTVINVSGGGSVSASSVRVVH